MRLSRTRAGRAVSGVVVLSLVVCAMTACTSDPGPFGRATKADPASDPAVLLAASTQALEQESYRFEVTLGATMSATGAVDPAAEAGSVTVNLTADGTTLDLEGIFVGSELWISLSQLRELVGVETEWMHIDQSRLGGRGLAGLRPGELDLVGAAEMLEDLGTVERIDANTFQGEITLTRGEASALVDQLLQAIGEDSVTLHFTATVDDQGRLTHLVVEYPPIPELPAEELDVRYFDFGSPVEVTPPPAEQVTELPAELYRMFGG